MIWRRNVSLVLWSGCLLKLQRMIRDESFDHNAVSGAEVVAWLIKDGAAPSNIAANALAQAFCASGILVKFNSSAPSSVHEGTSARSDKSKIGGSAVCGSTHTPIFTGLESSYYTLTHVPLMQQEAALKSPLRSPGKSRPRFFPSADAAAAAATASTSTNEGTGSTEAAKLSLSAAMLAADENLATESNTEGPAENEVVLWTGFLRVSRKDFLSTSEFHFGPMFVVLTSARLLHHKVRKAEMGSVRGSSYLVGRVGRSYIRAYFVDDAPHHESPPNVNNLPFVIACCIK